MRGLSLLALLVLSPRLAAAQTADRAVIHRVVDSVAALVANNYVVPDTGRMIAEHLRERRRSGSYDVPLSLAQLADRLTADLKAVNGDQHLYVNFTGAAARQAPPDGRQMVRRRPGEGVPPEQLLQARRANHDITRAERLPGNVGYLSIELLSARGGDEVYRVIDAAMALLERTDAMIIDLRRTPGGDPRVSDYVASYFFGPDSVRTLTSYNRSFDMTFERWTRKVTGKQQPDIPLYVLVGRGSASAAEDLAFIFKQTGRGTLVGERTAGAGRLAGPYAVGDGFVVMISGGRTFDPRTGKEWERTGIEPDVAVPADDALTNAHLHALQVLATASTDTAWKRSLLWAREAVAARATPVAVPSRTLASYAGTYDVRIIEVRGNRIFYKRDASRAAEELTPLDDHTFALGESTRIEFVRDRARVTAMRFLTPTAPPGTFPRNP